MRATSSTRRLPAVRCRCFGRRFGADAAAWPDQRNQGLPALRRGGALRFRPQGTGAVRRRRLLFRFPRPPALRRLLPAGVGAWDLDAIFGGGGEATPGYPNLIFATDYTPTSRSRRPLARCPSSPWDPLKLTAGLRWYQVQGNSLWLSGGTRDRRRSGSRRRTRHDDRERRQSEIRGRLPRHAG